MISSAPVATDWSEWSPCSKDCGGGERGRTMTRVEGNAGDELCPTPVLQQFVEEREPCNTHVCPFWAEWGSWPSCSKSCKKDTEHQPGTRQRSRECVGHVDEANTCSKIMSGGAQNEPCNTHECPVDGTWSNWTLSGECWNAQVILGCQDSNYYFLLGLR